MSFTRWVLYASFTGGILALSLQPIGIANAAQASAILVADQPMSGSQDTQRDSRIGKKSTSDAESSGRLQGNKQLGSGSMESQSGREQGGGTSQSSRRRETTPGGSSGSSSLPTPPSSGSGMSGSGMSGSATGSR